VEIVGSGKWVSVEYDGSEGKSTRLIRPDRIYTDRGFWYLNAYDGAVARTLRVDRVLSFIEATEPDSVEPELPYNDPSHPLVTVRLTKKGARMVQRDPHMGGLVDVALEMQELSFRCPPSEFDWYSGYFGGMGREAIVLGPERLREMMRVRGLEQIRLYEKVEDSFER
jgi:predicted DNA-binding transcriptional regulator YafY